MSDNTVSNFPKREIYPLWKQNIPCKNVFVCTDCLCTCVSGGSRCPGGLNESRCEFQNVLHQVQKGGDFPVIVEGSAGQELVDQRQQSLQPQEERRVGGRNISMSREKQETESARGRHSGCIPPQVKINSLHSCACADMFTPCDKDGSM